MRDGVETGKKTASRKISRQKNFTGQRKSIIHTQSALLPPMLFYVCMGCVCMRVAMFHGFSHW